MTGSKPFISLAVACLVVLAGLSTGSDGAQAAVSVKRGPAYETYTGSVDDFYVVPSPLPPGQPGQLIRVQAVSSNATSTTMRIMYHSIDGAGRDRAVTGTLTYPNAPAPAGGWPVMSIANGTVGLGPQCALSRGNNSVYDFGIGGVAVDSDYIGEGPVGEVQAYLSRESEGHSVLDAVRAARNFAAAHAGDRFVVLGGSQGGHGALSTNELAASYAPELHLLGTVALAPAAMFDKTYGNLDRVVTLVVTVMGFIGQSTEHPEIDLSDYVSPEGMATIPSIRSECTVDIAKQVLGVTPSFFTHDPRDTEPAHSIMEANDVGNVAAPSPVFLIQGTADTTVNPSRTDDLFARMCGVGQVTEYLKVPGADHTTVTQMALPQIEAWLQDRLHGKAAPDSCAPTTTSTTVPSSTTTTLPPGTTRPMTTIAPVVAADHDATTSTSQDSTSSGNERGLPTSGALPVTGAPLAPLGSIGIGIVSAGLLCLAALRRRRPARSS